MSVAMLQELNKSNEWKCRTAAQNNGVADDCNSILSNSLGVSSLLVGNACCYEWTGDTDWSTKKDASFGFVSNAFKDAGYPVTSSDEPTNRCFSNKVFEKLPGWNYTDGLNGQFQPVEGLTLTAVCSGAKALYAGVVTAVVAYQIAVL